MQRIDNRLVYSTTDIVGALECRHLAQDVGERAVEGLQGAPVSEVEVAPDPRRLWRAGDDWVRPRLRAGALDVGLPEVAEGPRRSRRSRCRPLDPPPARDVAGIVREQPELPGRTDHLVVDGSNDSLGRRIHGREGVDDRHARTVAVVQRVTDPGLGQVQQERARGGFKSHRRHSSTSRERDLILAAQSLEVDLDTRSRPSCIALAMTSAWSRSPPPAERAVGRVSAHPLLMWGCFSAPIGAASTVIRIVTLAVW